MPGRAKKYRHGEYPLTESVRARMYDRVAEQGARGLARGWFRQMFSGYLGWAEALDELVASGRVECRRVVNRGNDGGYPRSPVYFATDRGRRTASPASARDDAARDQG